MISQGISSGNRFILSEQVLRRAAAAVGADSIVCFQSARFTPLPRENLATAALAGFYNIEHDATIYTLPCKRIRDWLWNPNVDEMSDWFGSEDCCEYRLLSRLHAQDYFKVVVGRWLVVVFLHKWKGNSKETWKYYQAGGARRKNEDVRPLYPNLVREGNREDHEAESESNTWNQDVCYREAFRLARCHFENFGSDSFRASRYKETSARTRRVISDLAPEHLTGFPDRFCEYLEALAVEIVRAIWPAQSFHVSASVNLFQYPFDIPSTKENAIPRNSREVENSINPLSESVLAKIVELPLHSQRLRGLLLGRSPEGRGVILRCFAAIGRTSISDYASLVGESMCLVGAKGEPTRYSDKNGFRPGSYHRGYAKRTLLRHASYFGEAHYLYDYFDRLPWRLSGGEGPMEVVDSERLPLGMDFLADLQPIVKKCPDAVDVIIPLVDADGESCIGAINIEGVASFGDIDPMNLYIAQHIARSATMQIREMRYRQARDDVRKSVHRVLDNDMDEGAVLHEVESACLRFAALVDNCTSVEFLELNFDDGLKKTLGVPFGDPVVRRKGRWEPVLEEGLRRLIARVGYVPDSHVEMRGQWNGVLSDGATWQKVKFVDKGDEGASVSIHKINGPTGLPAKAEFGDPTGGLDDCTKAVPIQENEHLLLIPLFVAYPDASSLRKNPITLQYYCAGVLAFRGVREWVEALGKGELGKLVTEFKALVTLLQRSRTQSFAMLRNQAHEVKSVQGRLLTDWMFGNRRDDAIARAIASWAFIQRHAFEKLSIARFDFDDSQLGDELEELRRMRLGDTVRGNNRRLVCLSSFLRNAQGIDSNAGWRFRNGNLLLETLVGEGTEATSWRQIRWYPRGRPGRGRFVGHYLAGLFEDVCVDERILLSEVDEQLAWTVTIAPRVSK